MNASIGACTVIMRLDGRIQILFLKFYRKVNLVMLVLIKKKIDKGLQLDCRFRAT